jgi:hypothetical protein
MQHVLDLDLDFFVQGVASWRGRDHDRLDADAFPAWDAADAHSFLRERCGLDRPVPGVVVEHHGELFSRWRDVIQAGVLVPPFHVTHVDAHADLGLGDSGYAYLMTSLLFERPEDRRTPREGQGGLDDGNYLAFAVACRWLSELIYVFNEGGGDDLLIYHLEGFDPHAERLQLVGVRSRKELSENLLTPAELKIDHREPPVPFKSMRWDEFQADHPFDFICLSHSPSFTPVESDGIFDEIRRRFIDEAGI